AQDRREILPRREARQDRVLSPARAGPRGCVCLHSRGDGREHVRARRRGRHRSLHREAPAEMGGSVARAPAPASARGRSPGYSPMSNNSDIVFTPAARQAQAERGSAQMYEKRATAGFLATITSELAAFIAERDTAFLATVAASGAPYIQHRGGPKGFIQGLDQKTLGFAHFSGNP